MCRGIIKTGSTKVPSTVNPEPQKAATCPNQYNMSFLQSLLEADPPSYPAYYHPDKQPIKRKPVYNAENVDDVPASLPAVKKVRFSSGPTILKAEKEYCIPDTDVIAIMKVDSFNGCINSDYSSLNGDTSGLGLLTDESEPWEKFLDDLQVELDFPPPSSGHKKEDEEKETGGSLIAQLLSTEKPVRDMYMKLETAEIVDNPLKKKTITTLRHDSDSGYDGSPPPHFDWSSLSPSTSYHGMDPAMSQLQISDPVFSPISDPETSPSPPHPVLSPQQHTNLFTLSSNTEQELLGLPFPTDKDMRIEQLFEPTRLQWEDTVFISPLKFPQEDTARNQLSFESDLVLAETFFNPDHGLGGGICV